MGIEDEARRVSTKCGIWQGPRYINERVDCGGRRPRERSAKRATSRKTVALCATKSNGAHQWRRCSCQLQPRRIRLWCCSIEYAAQSLHRFAMPNLRAGDGRVAWADGLEEDYLWHEETSIRLGPRSPLGHDMDGIGFRYRASCRLRCSDVRLPVYQGSGRRRRLLVESGGGEGVGLAFAKLESKHGPNQHVLEQGGE